MNQIFGVGMMYRTSEYKNYAGVYLNPDNTVKPGNKVLYGKYAGTEIQIEGEDYLIMRESDILAIV